MSVIGPGPGNTPPPNATAVTPPNAVPTPGPQPPATTAAAQIAYLQYQRQQIGKQIAANAVPLTSSDVVVALYDVGITIARALQALADALEQPKPPAST